MNKNNYNESFEFEVLVISYNTFYLSIYNNSHSESGTENTKSKIAKMTLFSYKEIFLKFQYFVSILNKQECQAF